MTKLCSVCGSPEHPDYKAHLFTRKRPEITFTIADKPRKLPTVVEAKLKRPSVLPAKPREVKEVRVKKQAHIKRVKRRKAGTFDRVKYQREYMRKVRKAEREARGR